MADLFQPHRYIAIEGPVGAGKSLVADMLAEETGGRRIAGKHGNQFLTRFQSGDRSAALPAQMWFLMSRYEQLCAAAEEDARCGQSTPLIADYILQRDKLFACLNLNSEELALYNRHYGHFREQLPSPDLVIYLQTSPQVLRRRLRARKLARVQRITMPYLERIVAAYEHFFFHYTTSDLLVINTDRIDLSERNPDLQLLLRRVTEPIRGKQYFLPFNHGSAGVHRKIVDAGRSAVAASAPALRQITECLIPAIIHVAERFSSSSGEINRSTLTMASGSGPA
ncbi:MAG TPA: deoxynucleoside kinase [Acidobacteriaceae bacterium]|nr:deoxynucleoside kinase [Acidobacteriaceae bacterium]